MIGRGLLGGVLSSPWLSGVLVAVVAGLIAGAYVRGRADVADAAAATVKAERESLARERAQFEADSLAAVQDRQDSANDSGAAILAALNQGFAGLRRSRITEDSEIVTILADIHGACLDSPIRPDLVGVWNGPSMGAGGDGEADPDPDDGPD